MVRTIQDEINYKLGKTGIKTSFGDEPLVQPITSLDRAANLESAVAGFRALAFATVPNYNTAYRTYMHPEACVVSLQKTQTIGVENILTDLHSQLARAPDGVYTVSLMGTNENVRLYYVHNDWSCSLNDQSGHGVVNTTLQVWHYFDDIGWRIVLQIDDGNLLDFELAVTKHLMECPSAMAKVITAVTSAELEVIKINLDRVRGGVVEMIGCIFAAAGDLF